MLGLICTEPGFEGGRTESSIAVSPAMSASGIGIVIVAQRWEDIDGSIVLYTQSYKDLVQSKSLDNRCEVYKIRLVRPTVLKYRLCKKWTLRFYAIHLARSIHNE